MLLKKNNALDTFLIFLYTFDDVPAFSRFSIVECLFIMVTFMKGTFDTIPDLLYIGFIYLCICVHRLRQGTHVLDTSSDAHQIG